MLEKEEIQINENVLLSYLDSQEIINVLKIASDFEIDLVKGEMLAENISIKSEIYDNNLWFILLQCPHGEVSFLQIDKNQFFIQSVNIFKGMENIRSIGVDFKDPNSLKESKEFLKEDPVLKNIKIKGKNTSYGDEILFITRNMIKDFNSYTKNFGFLWENTGLKNAREIKNFLITNYGLII